MDKTIETQALTKKLIDGGMTPNEIAEALEGRVSPRTIYRWARGESVPGNSSDFDALQALANRKESA